jgi:hypothetical protein
VSAGEERRVVTFWVHAAVHVVRAISEHHKKSAARASIESNRRETRFVAPPSDRTLFVDAKWERMDGAREIRLGVRGGVAFLTLCDPAPNAVDGWSDAVIEARDVSKGAAFVKAVAGWLDVAPPPRPRVPGAPAPFALRWSRTGKADGVETLLLSFAWRGRCAEILLHARSNAHMVKFVEKSTSMRADLVAILATALRDGAPE